MTLRSSVFGFLVAYLHSTKPCWHSFALFDCCFGAVEEVLSVEVVIILCPSSLDYWLAGVILFCLLAFGVYSHLFLICFLSSFHFCLFIPIVFIFFLCFLLLLVCLVCVFPLFSFLLFLFLFFWPVYSHCFFLFCILIKGSLDEKLPSYEVLKMLKE